MSPKNKSNKYSKYISPLHMNGLHGRMLVLPPNNKKITQEVLLIYGQNSNIEYWLDIAGALSRYGRVTVPDLPGFGGMESFYKIHEKANIETLSDYLASFIKLRYKRKRITLVGCSFGFVVITRMLQKYPELVRKIDLLFAVSSLAHHDDLAVTYGQSILLRSVTRVFSGRLPAQFYRWLYLDTYLSVAKLRKQYQKSLGLKRPKSPKLNLLVGAEIGRRKQSDTRTYMKTFNQVLTLDNCQQRINLNLWHVSGAYDEYLNNKNVEQHFKIIFTGYDHIKLDRKTKNHKPVFINSEKVGDLIPARARALLREYSTR